MKGSPVDRLTAWWLVQPRSRQVLLWVLGIAGVIVAIATPLGISSVLATQSAGGSRREMFQNLSQDVLPVVGIVLLLAFGVSRTIARPLFGKGSDADRVSRAHDLARAAEKRMPALATDLFRVTRGFEADSVLRHWTKYPWCSQCDLLAEHTRDTSCAHCGRPLVQTGPILDEIRKTL